MKGKVCIAMSGGVDSSVAAALLVEQGYECFGAFMKNWSVAEDGVAYKPWEDEAKDAEAVCDVLGIPFYIFDFEAEYHQRVVAEFVAEYSKGRTPNPDVLCNREIKFDLFLKKALTHGASLIATGHYAQIGRASNRYQLQAGLDQAKDQSYFLYTLTQKELKHILFPIGHLRKSAVRALAHRFHLSTAVKKDSQGICFMGQVSMRQFLQKYLVIKPGDVVSVTGKVLGQHQGVIFYTEGQRHGFDTGGSHEPLYVAEKRIDANQLVVVPANHPLLCTSAVTLISLSWTDKPIKDGTIIQVRVRYRQPLHTATVLAKNGQYVVQFARPIQSVSVGQSLVFYSDGLVLGGGVINELR